MWRGANNNKGGAGIVADGEVRVERVEKIEAVMNGTPSATTAKAALSTPATTASGKAAAVPADVNELAEEFIRRNRAAFQGMIGDHAQN
ncbi:unnamed protein product [Urochloa humidicola]